MTEAEKMRQGLWLDANCAQEVLDGRLRAEDFC